ncbi:MAG: AI-2E family transporter, partial [Leptolyngbyaceae cyanobacterium bins.59]|nr:AI-2E family transporter [Leptolyngbyaceae cyanobacterium bins.59]
MNLGKWIGLLALIAASYILWEIRQVLLLVFAAVVLAIAINLLARRIQEMWGVQRGLSVILSILPILLVLAGVLLLIVPAFATQFQELTYLVPRAADTVDHQVRQFRTSVPNWALPYLPDVDSLVRQLQPVFNQLVGRSFNFFSSSLGILLNFLLVVVLALMFLANPQEYRQSFIYLFPSFYRRRI